MQTKIVACAFLVMMNQSIAGEPDLCTDLEEVYFSCASDNKVISLCLTKGFSPTVGELTYRYGDKDHLELVFASNYADLNANYQLGVLSYAKGSTSELSFTRGDLTYTVHQDLHVFRPNSSGVFVEQQGKHVEYKKCDHPHQKQRLGLFDLKEIGLVTGEARGIGTLGD